MVPMSLTYGLLGRYLGHSFSPAIHRQLGAYDYQLIELPPEKVGPFLQSGQFQGLNVTIPYKKDCNGILSSPLPCSPAYW